MSKPEKLIHRHCFVRSKWSCLGVTVALMISRWFLFILESLFVLEDVENAKLRNPSTTRTLSSAIEAVDPLNSNATNRTKIDGSKSWQNDHTVIWKYSFPPNLSFHIKQIPYHRAETLGKEYTAWDRTRWNCSKDFPGYRAIRNRIAAGKNPRHIKKIWIWGERNSCTTAITRSLLKNFKLVCQSGQLNQKLTNQTAKGVHDDCVIGGLPWKHDFMRRADLAHQNTTLNILLTRHPYEWLDSMHRIGFGANFHQIHDFLTFLSLEWASLGDDDPVLGRYLQYHHPRLAERPGYNISLNDSIGAINTATYATTLTTTTPDQQSQNNGGMLPESTAYLDCITASRENIFGAGWCWYQNVQYVCTPLPGVLVSEAVEDTPIQGCFKGEYSYGTCSHGMWLCERDHRLLHSLHPAVWRNAVLAAAGAHGASALERFQKIRSKLEESHLVNTAPKLAREAVDRLGRGDDAQETLLPLQLLQPLDLAVTGALQQAQHDLLHVMSGVPLVEYSAAHQGSWPNAQGWVFNDPKQCLTAGMVPTQLDVNDTCSHDGRLYQCLEVPGWQVSTGNEAMPSRHCFDGDHSWMLCSGGRFLCAVHGPHPWDFNLDDWNLLMSLMRSTLAGTSSSSSWRARLSHLRRQGIPELMLDRDPETGERFPTLLAMREAKLRDWVKVQGQMDFSSHIACRDYMLDGAELLNELEQKFALQRKPDLNDGQWDLSGCVWSKGKCNFDPHSHRAQKVKYYLSGRYMEQFSETSLRIANAWLDPEVVALTLCCELEAIFGYKLFGSVEQASQHYTRKNRCRVHGSCSLPGRPNVTS